MSLNVKSGILQITANIMNMYYGSFVGFSNKMTSKQLEGRQRWRTRREKNEKRVSVDMRGVLIGLPAAKGKA
jgi:hypothetical protein